MRPRGVSTAGRHDAFFTKQTQHGSLDGYPKLHEIRRMGRKADRYDSGAPDQGSDAGPNVRGPDRGRSPPPLTAARAGVSDDMIRSSTAMRFTFSQDANGDRLPSADNTGVRAVREGLMTFARKAEKRDVASLWVSDHVVIRGRARTAPREGASRFHRTCPISSPSRAPCAEALR